MQPKIALITMMTDHVPGMVKFYVDGLGFKVKVDMGQYVEIESDGVRFAICDRQIMFNSTCMKVTARHSRDKDSSWLSLVIHQKM